MSDNKLVIQPVKPEARSSNTLDTLVAKKDLDGVAVQETFDLANASIQNTDVLRALPRKIEPRAVKSNPSLTSRQAPPAKSSGKAPQKHGLLKNPLFKYEWGVINKLLSFFANLLKVIEQFVLGALGSSAQSIFFAPQANGRAKKDSAVDEEKEERLKQSRNSTHLTIKRS